MAKPTTSFAKAVPFLVALALMGSTFLDLPQFNDWLFRICMLVMLATSWNLMANAGLVSLGHSAFWGIGSYASVLGANELGLPLSVSLALSILVGAALGALLAVATGRLRGIFFAICTLALSEGLRVTALMLPDLTGGAAGLFLQQALRPRLGTLFLLGAGAAVLSVAIAARLSRIRFHYACRAMRSNEDAAQMLGIDPRRYRMGILALSAAMASCAGGINAGYGGYLDPDVAFSLSITIQAQIAPILGGMYTIAGPVIGAVAIIGFSEATRILLGAKEGVSQLAYGAILVLGVLFMPQGIYGSWRRLVQRRSAALAAPVRP